MTTTSTLSLNQGQKAAAEGFFNFLFSNNPELVISGPGGTGKTFLMGNLIDEVMPQYHKSCQLLGIKPLYHSVMMTATTNKAAEVLGQATGRPTQTIHSFLGLRVQDDYTTGVSKLLKGRNWKVHSNLILFVDESSMIDFPLRQYIKEGTIQSKIIYVGDHCQLAPVKEKLSPVYRDNLPFFELTEPMRTDNIHLQAVNEQLRETVKSGVFRPIKLVPGVIDLLDDPTMQQELELHFRDQNNHDRILAYSNNRVIQYNEYIREMRGLPPLLTIGEHVINNSAMQIGRNMMSVEDEFLITQAGSRTKKIPIEPGVELEVQYCNLEGRHYTFLDVPIPVDKNHFKQLTKYYGNNKNWTKYYELKNNYPDLRPRDAATIHKAQGSTYDTVFIDMEDLSTCHDKSMAARLLYVAFTRARKRVVLYGNLVAKYGGIVS